MNQASYAARCRDVQKRMIDDGIDYMFVSVSSDLRYLTGYSTWPSERLTLFVLPSDQEPFMVMPAFEAPLLRQNTPHFRIITWDETSEPIDVVVNYIGGGQGFGGTIAVNSGLEGRFLVPLMHRLRRASWVMGDKIVSKLREVKTPDEIQLLRLAQGEATACLARLSQYRFSGRTELELGQELMGICMESKLRVTNLAIVASGPNGAHPHYHIGDRQMREGDAVVIDFGGVVDGYHADITRTFHVGAPTPGSRFAEAYDLVRRAQEAAFANARSGVAFQTLDQIARAVIREGGYGEYFTHRLGHSIGLDEHEPPYLVEGNSGQVRAGMTFTLEPGIYVEGHFGIRIEDVVLVTDAGAERFGDLTRDLVVVA